MTTKRLTNQRFSTIINAMNYYETMIDDMELESELDRDNKVHRATLKKERQNFKSAMEWLLSLRPDGYKEFISRETLDTE
jgi:hypothetical protein